MVNQEKFNVREYKESDLPAILDLWEHHSDWGRPDVEEFQKWIKTPYGDCIIYIAENNEGEIIGQLYFTPTKIITDDIKSKALKLSAPIIHEKYRTGNVLNTNSLLIQLLFISIQSVMVKGYDWMYNFPVLGWKRVLQSAHNYGFTPWKVQTFPCIEIDENEKYPCKYELKIIDYFPTEVQQLWSLFRINNKGLSLFNRDLDWLNYKWGDDLKVGMYNQKGKFEGYAVIREQTGLLLDFIVPDKKVATGILLKMNAFFEDEIRNDQSKSKPGLNLMLTSYFKDLLKEVNTRNVDYQFVFGLSDLTANNKIDKMNIDKFYVFPVD